VGSIQMRRTCRHGASSAASSTRRTRDRDKRFNDRLPLGNRAVILDAPSSSRHPKPVTVSRLVPRDGFPSFRGGHDTTRYSDALTAIRPAASCRRSVDLVPCLQAYCYFGRFRAARTLLGHRRRDRSVGLDLVSNRSSCRDVFSGSNFPDEAAAITTDLVTAISSRQLYTEISGPS